MVVKRGLTKQNPQVCGERVNNTNLSGAGGEKTNQWYSKERVNKTKPTSGERVNKAKLSGGEKTNQWW